MIGKLYLVLRNGAIDYPRASVGHRETQTVDGAPAIIHFYERARPLVFRGPYYPLVIFGSACVHMAQFNNA